MAFRTQKISQMTPKGADLEATDLIEVSTIESGSYVTRSITGQEIIDAAVGNVDWGDIGGTLSNQTDLQNALDAKQDDITLTTTGSSGASTLVGSTLNVPNYTLSGLGGVPTSRTLTINGVTQDLSANRTFTISTGITIGSTAIASGTVGRILFEGTGNILQESANFSWDNTNRTLRVVTADPSTNARVLDITNSGGFGYFIRTNSVSSQGNSAEFICNNFALGTIIGFSLQPNGNASFGVAIGHAPTNYKTIEVVSTSNTAGGFLRMRNANSSAVLDLFTDTTEGVAIASNVQLTFRTGASGIKGTWFGTGNLLIGTGTQTDAGYKLDVNGTTRIQSKLSVGTPSAASAVMEVTSTTQGFLPPRMTTTQKNAIASPAAGLMVYDTTLNVISYYNGSMWI